MTDDRAKALELAREWKRSGSPEQKAIARALLAEHEDLIAARERLAAADLMLSSESRKRVIAERDEACAKLAEVSDLSIKAKSLQRSLEMAGAKLAIQRRSCEELLAITETLTAERDEARAKLAEAVGILNEARKLAKQREAGESDAREYAGKMAAARDAARARVKELEAAAARAQSDERVAWEARDAEVEAKKRLAVAVREETERETAERIATWLVSSWGSHGFAARIAADIRAGAWKEGK